MGLRSLFARVAIGVPLLVIAIVAFRLAIPVHAEAPQSVNFNFHIKPILSDRCYTCHGPDENKREADLRLDQPDGLFDDSSGYAVLVAGKPDESELIRRVTSHDEFEMMPPPEAKLPPVSAEEVELLRRWITDGAEWAQHWSFIRSTDTKLPAVSKAHWPKGPIDRFVLAQLEQAGYQPASEAKKEKLLRRVSFDLIGLPPTLSEIDEFVQDSSPGAFEKVVERLLASPHYGERMASPWLDLARYSDTYGYQIDKDRYVWPWRDWVTGALNNNMPYDQFITWQLAGDLLPEATDEQILATAFNRLHPQKAEGGSTPEEFRVEYVADRVHTFGTAMLGLTLECCRCHDHKYDPISQREYYQLFAFFDNVDESGLYSFFTKSTPTPALLLADAKQKQHIVDVEANIEKAQQRLEILKNGRIDAFETWLGDQPGMPTAENISGLIAQLDFEHRVDGKFVAKGSEPPFATSSTANRIVKDNDQGNALLLTGDDEVKTVVGNFTRNDPFTVASYLNTPDEKQRAVVFHRSRAWTDAGSRGYELLIVDGKLRFSLIHFWPGNAVSIQTRKPIAIGTWHHVAVTSDGSSRAAGLRIYIDGILQECEVVRDKLTKNITGGGRDHLAIGARYRDRGFKGGMVDQFQVFDRELTPLEIASLCGIKLGKQREALYAYYLATEDAVYREQIETLQQLRDERSKLVDPIPEIMVMRETPQPRQTFLLERGLYNAPGDSVEADTPAVLGSLGDRPRNRLGLARWLTDSGNPLLARVAVNRFWQNFFGHGLVRTPEDFGSQGELPTHPELLDWLAKDFIDHHWDTKRLVKQIVMSATYRQSSVPEKELLIHDPGNRLLARGPQHRLPAEAIRDNVLFVSGLLVDKIGGPPALPYQVAASFKPRSHDEGEGLYRRSLYTHWQQTGPAPVMMALDAAKREVCSVKRQQTSTPLQALVLLNDPQIVEAGRVLAEKLILKHGEETSEVLANMFRWLTSREPTADELQILRVMYDEQLAHFIEHPKQTTEYLTLGETERNLSIESPRLAAMAVVAVALMNYDECVMKR